LLLRVAVQQGGDALTVALFQRFAAGGVNFQVAQSSVLNAVNPAVQRDFLAAFPGRLHHRGVTEVVDLLDHIQFAQFIETFFWRQFAQQGTVFVPDVPDMQGFQPPPAHRHSRSDRR